MKTLKLLLTIAAVLFLAAAAQAQEIFDAVKNNGITKVKQLIEKDASVINLKDAAGNTPLHIAALNGSVSITELLLSKGADINSVNTQLNTPLQNAIISLKDNVSKLLVEKGANLNRKNVFGETPLHTAVLYNRKEIVELLILKGADIEIRNEYQRTPILIAARETGNVEIGNILIKNGADINIRDRHNDTPLNLAPWKGFVGFVDLLLDKGAEFDTTRRKSLTLLRDAANCGSARLFKVVLEKGKNLFTTESAKNGVMLSAIAGGSVEIVKTLLAMNIPIKNDADVKGWTPLHYAANNGRLDMIEFLVEKGADINKRTLSGKSVYNAAEEASQKEALKLILKLGGNSSPQQFPELKGQYLGQAPPGNAPTIFAPDIVSAPHSSISISPNGKEMYWVDNPIIMTSRLENDKWTKPQPLLFSQADVTKYWDDVPFISPDGMKMFFISSRPLRNDSTKKENFWYVDKTPTGWSDPKPLCDAVNAMAVHWGFSVSNSGSLYFSAVGPEGYGDYDIYYSRFQNGDYSKPINVGSTINGNYMDHCPFIAPDESYLIFGRVVNRVWTNYISFKDKNGQWLTPIKLEASLNGGCPIVTPDGKYVFFMGSQWASAKFIEELRPKE